MNILKLSVFKTFPSAINVRKHVFLPKDKKI